MKIMQNPINRIYARTNLQGIVTHIFSEAFEQPQWGDICIDETNTDRHGANKYQVYDENGIANYGILNGKLVIRDKTVDTMNFHKQEQITELKQKLANTDYQAIKFAEGEITESEFIPIRVKRAEWREQINKLEQLL